MTTWWNNNINNKDDNRADDFLSWIKGFNEEDRIYCRKYIVEHEYKSMLDVGCGLCVEYYGFKNDGYHIEYTGLDSCKHFIETNSKDGINIIEAEIEEKFPIDDNIYDCVYARDILEHLSHYRKTVNELIRVAKEEVIINWFIKPGYDPTHINYWEDEDLYHNKYNYNNLEKFVLSNPKVEKIFWRDINFSKTVLHIILKQEVQEEEEQEQEEQEEQEG